MTTISETLTFQQGDPTWHRLRKRALEDLYWFNFHVLGYGSRVPMSETEHLLLCRFAEKRTGNRLLDTARYRKIEVPREVGKTTCITQGYTVQCICANPETSILLVNEKVENAKDFLSEIKRQFETNEFLRALFPEVIPPDLNDTTWRSDRITVNRKSSRKEPTVFVIGEGGTVTGMHPDRIIVDDILSKELMENIRGGDGNIVHRINRYIHQLDMLPSQNAKPFPEIIFIGTRWWYGDSYEHIEVAFGRGEAKQYVALRAQLPDGSMQQLPTAACYRIGDLAVFRRAGLEDGRVAFPSKWSAERMANVRLQDPELFACNVMNDPANETIATFKTSWLKYYSWLDEQRVSFDTLDGKRRVLRLSDLDILIFVDPGGFGSRAGEDRARAAVCVTGSTGAGEHLLLEAFSENISYLDAARKIIEFASRYEPRKVCIEIAGQQAAFVEVVRRIALEAGLQLSLHSEKPGVKAKENRVLGLESFFQRGQFYVGRGAPFAEFMEQYQRFPRAIRVDLLDALAYAPAHWRKQSGAVHQSPAERRSKELAAYHERLKSLRG